ncbi:hypothetical protein MWU50_06455 [Flavobacteriaceae bacterium S0862]|nr:hypothetical protein [Flavobacteriaceae bacterium S0862]
MKAINEYLKPVAFVLSFLILLQGCTVYKSAPISIEEASKMDTAVRVITKDNEKLKYDRIVKENGKYYSVKNERTADVIKPIDTMQIKEVKAIDKTGSTVLTIGVIVTGVGALLVGISAMLIDIAY